MIKKLYIGVAMILLCVPEAFSQTADPPKFEVAAEFSSLTRSDGGSNSSAGFGGRFTFNFNKNIAIEAAAYAFPGKCFGCEHRGQVYQAVAGPKVGKRFEKWGIFAKARPGIATLGQELLEITPTGSNDPFPFQIGLKGVDTFALDLGGVVEFYPTKRIVTRFDIGDTLLRFPSRKSQSLAFDPTTNTYTLIPFTLPAKTTNNFQVSASVGFRF